MNVPRVAFVRPPQVAPKPLTSTTVVGTTQTQQRLIMPATPLPQIQHNFTNLSSAVLAQAPGGGNVGYTVLPAQYVTQVRAPSSSPPPSPTLTSHLPSMTRNECVSSSIERDGPQLPQPQFVTPATSSSFPAAPAVQTPARLPLNG